MLGRLCRWGVVAAALALGVSGPLTAASPGEREAGFSSVFETTAPSTVDCLDPVVEKAVLDAALADGGQTINLDVRVLLDGISLARGQQVMGLIGRTFTPLRISIRATYEGVAFSGNDAAGLIQQAKNHTGGARPAGSDLVHVLTQKNLMDSVPGAPQGAESPAPAGAADCVGGVRYADRAYSVSEAYGAENFRMGPVMAYFQAESKIAAHEIAHLLGGQHHLSNCVEGAASELEVPEVSPCTLMFPTVDAASFNLSTVNAKIVRGYTLRYAAP